MRGNKHLTGKRTSERFGQIQKAILPPEKIDVYAEVGTCLYLRPHGTESYKNWETEEG